MSTEYQGNKRFVSNADQTRCHCGWFLSENQIEESATGYRWHCERCGPNRAYEL